MADTAQRIGFVGVGRMGANMARHLNDEGYTVSAVYDAQRGLAESLAGELGCEAPDTLAGVTASSDVIITVVTDDSSMRDIFGESGDSLLTGADGRVFINCATITPQVHVDVEALAEGAGASSLEACMASSITQARDGTLYLMCGGREAVYQQVEPLLETLSISRRYIGPAGTAAQVKALVNMVMNINTAGLAEGWASGRRWVWTWTCSKRCSRRLGPTRGCSKPTARTWSSATTKPISRRRTRPRTRASPCRWPTMPVWTCRWRRPRKRSTTR